MTDEPVLVTVEEPNTAKFCAVPSDGAVCAYSGSNKPIVNSKAKSAASRVFTQFH